jgi:hypothetical protein
MIIAVGLFFRRRGIGVITAKIPGQSPVLMITVHRYMLCRRLRKKRCRMVVEIMRILPQALSELYQDRRLEPAAGGD